MRSERLSKMRSKIPVVIVAISLLATVVMTVFNLYLTLRFNQDLANLGFSGYTFNATSVIVAKANDANLGKPAAYIVSGGPIQKTVHYGILHASVQVLNSHYGALTISTRDFNVTLSEYLDVDKLNQTKVSFANQNESHTYILAPGLNQVYPQLELKAEIYPNPETFPSQGESVQFSLGKIALEAEFWNFDTQAAVKNLFSAEITIILEPLR